MQDVATLAGVSLKTVSRVINGEPCVAPATIAKVQDAAAQLRFQRNDLARSLCPGYRTHTLGFVIEDLENPFFPTLMQNVDKVAQARGYLVMGASTHADAERERELVMALLGRRVDGLLVVPFGADHRYIGEADGGDTATVFVSRPAHHIPADAVLVDNAGGTRQAVEHLVAHGHRRIAFVGDDPSIEYATGKRLAAFCEAMIASVGELDEQLIVTGRKLIAEAEVVHGQVAVDELLELPADQRPTAIVTNDNRATVGALRALRNSPERIALVGFDELELGDLLGVTVVRTNPAEMGRLAAELVLERIDGRSDEPQRVVVPTELIARGSGEIAP